MDMLIYEILEAVDHAVDERYEYVGEVTDETMQTLRGLMRRWHGRNKEPAK